MGYISNPIGLRLGLNRGWLVKGTADYSHYSYNMYVLFKRLCYTFFKSKRLQRLALLFSHVVFKPNTNNLFIFVYDPQSQEILLNKKQRFPRKYLCNQFFYLFYRYLSKRILYLFSISIKTFSNLKINIYPITNKGLTARAIVEYSLRKLKTNNKLNAIFYPIIRGFRFLFKGMRIICQGRFTRRQRASKMVYSFGKVSLNSFNQKIDYQFMDIPLKFGVGSVKLFLARR
jgi:hypothetical protein